MNTKIIKGKSPLANDAGEIYRTVKAEGIDAFLAAVSIFESLGMVNELQNLTSVQGGFNAIFQPPSVTLPKPVEGEPLSASIGI